MPPAAATRRWRHRLGRCVAALETGSVSQPPAPDEAIAAPAAGPAEASLSDAQRDECLAALDRDGFAVLPLRIPGSMVRRANAYMDGYCADSGRVFANTAAPVPAWDPRVGGNGYLTEMGIVELDAVFREYLTWKPALQLCYDVFGPTAAFLSRGILTALWASPRWTGTCR
eukprot:SAG22_NODE_4417_length_1276_cov_0.970263_2_plen_171_part_00